MDIKLALITGGDIPIPECKLILKQPTIKEIGMLGEKQFFSGIQVLAINKDSYIGEFAEELNNISNFELFSVLMHSPETVDRKNAVIEVLNLLFPDFHILFIPRAVVFNKDDENFIIDESNFSSLQEIIKEVFCLDDSSEISYNPGNAEAEKIAEKLRRGRQKVAQLKAQEMGNSSVFAQYTSIISVALGIDLLQVINYTMYQVLDLINRYNLYMAWDIDLKIRIAGGKPDSAPEDWRKNIH